MATDRRDFFNNLLAAGLVSGFLPASGLAQRSDRENAIPVADEPGSHDSADYWNGYFDSVSAPGHRTRGIKPALPAPERHVRFLHHGTAGLKEATDIEESELLDHSGDVSVSMTLGQFRPGLSDQDAFQRLQSAQLRLDCIQTKPLMNVLAPLAWSALASLNPDKAGKLPSLQALGFQSANALSGVNKIVLSGGSGKLGVNLSMMKRDSILRTVLKDVSKGIAIVAPVMNFPAMSVVALKTFTELYSYLEERTTFLLNGPLMHVVATQRALGDPERDVQYIPLVTGDYVMVPHGHLEELAAALPQLGMQQGYLVPNNADKSVTLEARAASAVPEVTYFSMRVAVAPITATALSDNGSGSGADSGQGSGSKKSGAAKKGDAAGAKPSKP